VEFEDIIDELLEYGTKSKWKSLEFRTENAFQQSSQRLLVSMDITSIYLEVKKLSIRSFVIVRGETLRRQKGKELQSP